MQIRTLAHTSLSEITQAFNAAFADYFVKLHVTDRQLEERLLNDGVDLSLSVGAFDKDRLAGFVLNAFDSVGGKVLSYNAGTGVIPAYRGKGLTKAMYRQVLHLAGSQKAEERWLEVIVENKVALNIYKSLGYEVVRELKAYRLNDRPGIYREGINFRFLESIDDELLDPFCDVRPSWQYSINSIKRSVAPKKVIQVLDGDRIIALAAFNPLTGRVLRFGVEKSYRRKGIGSDLFKIMDAHSNAPLTVINVDAGDGGISSFLHRLGFDHFLSQYEMAMTL